MKLYIEDFDGISSDEDDDIYDHVTLNQKLIDDYDTVKMFNIDIMLDSKKIGYVELFVSYDEDYEESSAYVKTIEINKNYRNHGIGTKVLKNLADKHGGIYICPDNQDAERLYARLGDVTSAPQEFQSEIDNWGVMYFIQ